MDKTLAAPSPLLKKARGQKAMGSVMLSFLLGCAVALAIFLPFWIVDKGIFIYAGDYNLQQIPFYMYVQQFIKNSLLGGGGTWSWATDMGSSIVTSYSFYNIGSPFLWITMLFPSRWLPYMMVPLYVLKFGCISGAAALYLSRYAKTRNMVVIVSLVYAFCGINVYNIFFNHMLDAVVFFPLLLWAMDGLLYEKKRGWFALFVGLALINSYFFFVGNVVFLLIYFVVKLWLGEYRITPQSFGSLALEAVLGVGLGMILALPSFINLMGNPRTDNFAYGFNLVMYWHVQQYFEIIASMFLPPDPPYLPNLFTEGAIRHTSMSVFLPVVSLAGVFAYFKAKKKSSIKTILVICFICAMVPFLNSSFYAFNASYYARWYYMPAFMMCFATLRALEDPDVDLEFGARAATIGTALFIIFGLLPNVRYDQQVLGVAQYASKFWLTIGTALFAVSLFYYLVAFHRKRKRFASLLLAAVMAFSVMYSVTHMALTKFPQWHNDSRFIEYMYEDAHDLTLPDDQFYRIDTYELSDNLGLWTDKSCLRTFNSVVSPSIMEFYPFVGVKRDVGSRPGPENYAVRGLLNVRFMIMPQDQEQAFALLSPGSSGWHYYGTQGSLVIYENENFVPLGFTYDTYCNIDSLYSRMDTDRGPLLVRALGLTQEQIDQYGHLFSGQLRVESANVDYTTYTQDTAARRAAASYETAADANGFTCKIMMKKDNLVFFGVPYDEGFTATVNGVETEVLKVSGGMMAVYAPAGDNTIQFTYETPAFKAGFAITMISVALLGTYLTLAKRLESATLRRKAARAAQLAQVAAARLPEDNLFEADFIPPPAEEPAPLPEKAAAQPPERESAPPEC